MSDFISKDRLKWEVEKWYEKEYYSSFNAAVYNALLKIIDKFPSVEQEKCEDCISRNAVLDLVADYDLSMGEVVRGIHALPSITLQPKKFGDCISKTELLKKQQIIIDEHGLEHKIVHIGKIIDAPSVEPERKPGHWEWDQRTGEYVCSECGCNPIYERTTPDCSEIDKYEFCRWCGAKMMDEQTLKCADTDTAFGGLQSAT